MAIVFWDVLVTEVWSSASSSLASLSPVPLYSDCWISLKDFPLVSGTSAKMNTVHRAAKTANMKNVVPMPIKSRTFEKNLVTMNATSHDVEPLNELAIALTSRTKISPTNTQGIGPSPSENAIIYTHNDEIGNQFSELIKSLFRSSRTKYTPRQILQMHIVNADVISKNRLPNLSMVNEAMNVATTCITPTMIVAKDGSMPVAAASKMNPV